MIGLAAMPTGRCPRVGLVGRCLHVRIPFSKIQLLTSIARKAIIRQTKWGCAWDWPEKN